MEKAKDQNRSFGIGLIPQQLLEAPEIIKPLVYHRQADNGVDDMGADLGVIEHPPEQGDTVSDGKQADIDTDILKAIEKENHPKQEQQVIVARYHMFGAQVDEGDKLKASVALNKSRVTFRYTVGQKLATRYQANADKQAL